MSRDFKNIPPVQDVFFLFEYELKFILLNRVPQLGRTFFIHMIRPYCQAQTMTIVMSIKIKTIKFTKNIYLIINIKRCRVWGSLMSSN